MVAPLLAQQFCQIQALGQEHGESHGGIPSAVQNTAVSAQLVASAWQEALRFHLDRHLVESFVNGMHYWFRVL